MHQKARNLRGDLKRAKKKDMLAPPKVYGSSTVWLLDRGQDMPFFDMKGVEKQVVAVGLDA
jgi:hypothetical protein